VALPERYQPWIVLNGFWLLSNFVYVNAMPMCRIWSMSMANTWLRACSGMDSCMSEHDQHVKCRWPRCHRRKCPQAHPGRYGDKRQYGLLSQAVRRIAIAEFSVVTLKIMTLRINLSLGLDVNKHFLYDLS